MKKYKYITLRSVSILFAFYQLYLFFSFISYTDLNFKSGSSQIILKLIISIYVLIPNSFFTRSPKFASTRVISLLLMSLILITNPLVMLMNGLSSMEIALISFSLIQIIFAATIPLAALVRLFPKN